MLVTPQVASLFLPVHFPSNASLSTSIADQLRGRPSPSLIRLVPPQGNHWLFHVSSNQSQNQARNPRVSDLGQPASSPEKSLTGGAQLLPCGTLCDALFCKRSSSPVNEHYVTHELMSAVVPPLAVLAAVKCPSRGGSPALFASPVAAQLPYVMFIMLLEHGDGSQKRHTHYTRAQRIAVWCLCTTHVMTSTEPSTQTHPLPILPTIYQCYFGVLQQLFPTHGVHALPYLHCFVLSCISVCRTPCKSRVMWLFQSVETPPVAGRLLLKVTSQRGRRC
jgi:hypothetical protein